jgi:ketosteroid isomerase-like protein
MESRPNDTLGNPSDNNRISTGETLATPHFDEESIQSARPAVPLERIKARRFWQLTLVSICVASLVGGVIAIALARYQIRSAQISTPAANVAPEGASQNGFSEPLPQSVASTEQKTNDAIPRAAEINAKPTRPARPSDNSAAQGEPISDTQDGEAHKTLHGALDEWIAATNARDIQRQMGFYHPTVNAFYLKRDVPLEAIRAEKSRVFGRADVVDVHAAAPGIRLSRDGRTATMRFRKKYAIEGGGEDRRGEVLQELRWRRTAGGWKIISERDLRVIP